jgi:S1-C subfamily serine protease
MENNLAQKITAFATIIALPFALGAFLLTWAPAQQFYLSDPRGDGYVPPRNIEKLITNVQDSTVTIFCRPNDPQNKGGFGSGWAIDLKNQQGKRFPTTLITNYHVIDECLDGKGKVTVLALFGKEYQAVIDNWDAENDLASIATALEVPPLKLSEYEPFPGYWVAAIGSADGYEGSVAFGNVLNGTKLEILITAPLSRGNSGGPLVDNEGNVVGTNTFGQIEEQYNGAMSLNALCVKIMECEGDVFWDRDN